MIESLKNRLKSIQIKPTIRLILIIIVILTSLYVHAEPGVSLRDKSGDTAMTEFEFTGSALDEIRYSAALMEYTSLGARPAENQAITLEGRFAARSSKGNIPVGVQIDGRQENVLNWSEEYDWFEWDFSIEDTGLYQIEIEYYPLEGTGLPAQREIAIDGTVPYLEAHNIALTRLWRDKGEPAINGIGDEVRPKQVEIRRWNVVSASDSTGMSLRPLTFLLNKGRHTLRMGFLDQPVAINRIWIRSPDEIPAYSEVDALYRQKGYRDAIDVVKFQAEASAIEKSDPTLRREFSGDPAAEPLARGTKLLNIMGGWRWSFGNQSITWQFEVPEDGLYKLGMHVEHSYNDGLPSYRQIAIDGKVPFEEMLQYKFTYQMQGFRLETLTDTDGNPYLFYLESGIHTLTMTVKMGPMASLLERMTDDILMLGHIIRQIQMITSSEPDPNYDYELHVRIPDLLDNFRIFSDSMQVLVDETLLISEKIPSMARNFATIKDQLRAMIDEPFIIASRLGELISAQESLGRWIQSLQRLPIVIDYFTFGPPDEKWKVKKSNIFQRALTTWVNFISSFTKDYTSISDYRVDQGNVKSTLDVWITRGKEWGAVLKELADEEFTLNTGIQIKLNVLPGGQLNAGAINVLMLSIISGNPPDVAIGMNARQPVEFAIRDAAVDLTQFSDFEEVKSRFLPGIVEPYYYEDGCYGIPETMNFSVLVYRKDILKEFGLGIPNTWDDVYKKVMPVLHRNRMDFTPAPLASFLYQRGGDFYTEDGLRSGLGTPEAYLAFKEWTEQFTSYKMPPAYEFYNRMRRGTMPIGIGDFLTYVRLSVAAPELIGRWGIAFLPGTRRPDGTIDRSTISSAAPMASIELPSGEGVMIVSGTDLKDEAWEFMKWWTSEDVQVQFGREVEALWGPEARWNTSNLAAFERLPWKREDLEIIQEQWKWYTEPPVVLGGYFTDRHIRNAFTRILMEGMNVRESLEMAVEDINRELVIKQEEYGVAQSR